MKHKKLTLLLLPLVPLTAIGVVEILDRLLAPAPSPEPIRQQAGTIPTPPPPP